MTIIAPAHIAAHWAEIVRHAGLCEECSEEAKVMFFAGAMAALHAMTGWDPATGNMGTINAAGAIAVSVELTTTWYDQEAEQFGQELRN